MANAPRAITLEPGATIGRKYRVVRQLGRGGMGVVLEAENIDTGARVAIKLLRETVPSDPDKLSRFVREARATACLKSRFVVTVYDADRDDDGAPYIVMELLDGRDLAGEIRARGAVPADELVGWMIQAAAGLATAHASGIVHRDLKPANLFLTAGASAVIKVVDFGVSKMVSEVEVTELTMSGDVFGTAHYMSPEQLRDSKYVDGRADIWGLGIILYRGLEGRMPFDGSSAEVVAKILGSEIEPLVRPDVPDGLRAAVRRALEKDPLQRFQSMGAFADALAPFARMTPQVAEALAEMMQSSPTQSVTMTAPAQTGLFETTRLASPVHVGRVQDVVPSPQPSAPGGPRRSARALAIVTGFAIVVLALGFVVWRRVSSATREAKPVATSEPSSSASMAPLPAPAPLSSEVPSFPAVPAATSAAASGAAPYTGSATPASRREPPRRATTPVPNGTSRRPHEPTNAPDNPPRL